MKKISIFLMALLGLMATSCDDEYAPAKPQENPQEPILVAGDITSEAEGPLVSSSVLALEDYNTENAKIAVMKTLATENLPAGASVIYKLQLSATEDFERSVTLVAEPEKNDPSTYYVSASEWNEAHVYLFGKSPKVKKAYYRVPVYILTAGTEYRLSSTDYYVAEGTIEETCMDQGFVIEDAYYFLSNGTTWALDNPAEVEKFAFEHSADVSVYDDPNFVIKFEVTEDVAAGGDYWKIAPKSAVETVNWDAVIGVEQDGDEALSGSLVTTNAQAGRLTEAGKYKLTINMENMTYKFEKILQPEYLYTPGGSNGWNQAESGWMQLNFDADNAEKCFYYGVFPVDGSFKICEEKSWNDKTDWGAETDAPALTGNLVLGNTGKNITVPDNGVYWTTVKYDLTSYELLSYILTPVTKIGIIGSFAASEGWSKDLVMTSADNGATWTVETAFVAGDEFKFRFNENWDMNLGESDGVLKFGADNIKVEQAGTYTVTLTLLKGVPAYTMTKK